MEETKAEKQPRVTVKPVLAAHDEIEYQSDNLGKAETLANKYGYTVKVESIPRKGISFVKNAHVRLVPRKGDHRSEKLEFTKVVELPSLPRIDKALGELVGYLRDKDHQIRTRRLQEEAGGKNGRLRILGRLARL